MASEQPGQQEGDFSEPEPRQYACGTVVQGKFILYRGLQESFRKLDLHNLPRLSEVHDFDHSPPAWETRQTTGPTPQAVYGSACTCIGPDLYVFAGYTGSQYTNELHAFNTVEALWRLLCPRNPSEGPMRKAYCGMIAIDTTTLIIAAGRGIPSGDIQPGSRFVKNTAFSDGRGYTNELHKYYLNIDLWSSPTTSGVTLPPCSSFTLTKVDLLRAVLFAGYQGDIRGHVSTAYVLSFHDWNWAVLHLNGPYQPVARQSHTAFSLQDPDSNPAHPRLVISCGLDNSGNPLRDMCILSVNDGSCEEIPLPLSFIARYHHTSGVFYMSSGKVKAVYFGGLTEKFDPKKTWKEQAFTAHTTVVELECEVRGEGSAAGWRATVKDPRALRIELVRRAEAIYSEALQHGYTEDRPTVVLLTGAAGSGKSHVRNFLLNLPPPPVRHSTALAESPVRAISATSAVAPADSGLFHQIEENQLLAHSIASGGRSSDSRSPPTIASSPVEERLQNTQQGEQEVASVNQHQSKPSPPTPAPVGDQQPAVRPEPQQPDLTPNTDPLTDIPTNLDSGFSGESTLDSDASGVVAQLGDDVKALINPASKSNSAIPQGDSIYIIDSGGQPQYAHIFPLLTQPPLVTLHVTNLSERLDQHPVVEYYRHGRRLSRPYKSPFTNEQLVMHAVRGAEVNTYRLTSTGSAPPTPKLVIIGTHRDREGRCSESITQKNTQLVLRLCPHFERNLVFCGQDTQRPIFPVNAKKPRRQDEAVMREVRAAISTARDAVEKIKTPHAWRVLMKALLQLSEKKQRSVLTKQEGLAVASQLHMDAEKFEVALHHLARIALVHYFPEILPGLVFCKSQVLLDKLTEIVEAWYELRSNPDPTKASHSNIIPFREEGMITQEILGKFPKHYVPEGNVFTSSHLLELMERRHLVARVSPTEFFMPAILPELSEEKLEKQRVSSSSPVAPLAFHFPDGIPPCGLFCSVASSLLSSGELELAKEPKNRMHPKLVARNCVKFVMPDGLGGELVLIDAFSHYELHVHSSVVYPCALYSKISAFVLKAMKEAITLFNMATAQPAQVFVCQEDDYHKAQLQSQSPEVEDSFVKRLTRWVSSRFAEASPVSPTPVRHVATVSADGQHWRCSVDPANVHGRLEARHLLWTGEEQHASISEEEPVVQQTSSGAQAQPLSPEAAPETGSGDHNTSSGSDSLPRSTTSSQVQAVAAGDDVAVRPAARGVLESATGASAVENPETNLGRVCEHHVAGLADVLVGVAGSWDIFLGQLGVDSGKQKSIQLSNANKPDFPERCLLQGLDHWVLSDASPTYERVARALRGDMLHLDQLAVEVEQFAKSLPTV